MQFYTLGGQNTPFFDIFLEFNLVDFTSEMTT